MEADTNWRNYFQIVEQESDFVNHIPIKPVTMLSCVWSAFYLVWFYAHRLKWVQWMCDQIRFEFVLISLLFSADTIIVVLLVGARVHARSTSMVHARCKERDHAVHAWPTCICAVHGGLLQWFMCGPRVTGWMQCRCCWYGIFGDL